MTNSNNLVPKTSGKGSLSNFIFLDTQNRPLAIISIPIIIIQIIIYKIIYPYASFIYGDSYCYIDEAIRNVQIDTYPIGYPMFLRAFSALTVSDTSLFIFQYLLMEISLLSLTFTIFYFHNPRILIKYLLLLFTVLNPLFLHLANTVSSDNLFFSLSLIWFTLLIWLVFKPTTKIAIYHAIVLFLAFTVRYNALYYPIISIVSIFLTKQPMKLKILGLVLSILLVGTFIEYNRDKYYELCRIPLFTPFAGWLMANNALYAYRYVPDSNHKKVPEKFIKLDSTVRIYFVNVRNSPFHPEEKIEAYYDYMWKDSSPLSIYWKNEYLNKEKDSAQKSWALAGALFNEYGKWIIIKYPVTFFQHVIVPNSKRWFTPPIEFLEHYNSGLKEVPDYIQKWFHYDNNIVRTNIKKPQILESINRLYSMLGGIMNLLFLACLITFSIFKKDKQNTLIIKIMIIALLLWITNYVFSVFASPIALRHQMFPIQITSIFSFIIIDLITNNPSNTKSGSN